MTEISLVVRSSSSLSSSELSFLQLSKLLNSILISPNDSVFFTSLDSSSIVHRSLLLELEDWSKEFCWMCGDFFVKCEEAELSSEDELKEIVLKSLPSLDIKRWGVASRMCQSVTDWVGKKSFTLWQWCSLWRWCSLWQWCTLWQWFSLSWWFTLWQWYIEILENRI